jgi:hypothetical protein
MRRLIVALFSLGAWALASPLAIAAPPVACPPGQEPHPKTGGCVIVVIPPPDTGSPGNPGSTSGPGVGGSAPAAKPVCRYTLGSPAKEVPCSSEQGWWVQSRQCYAKAVSPQPPKSDPAWEGRTEGAIYVCSRPILGPGGSISVWFWSASPPGVGAPPDPRMLAQQAVAVMNLRAVRIGMVPEPRPGRVGLVGLPVWMWAQDPDSRTWGPVTRTASAAGFTVTATAKATKVVWAMGDGETVVCRTPGTPYEDRFGMKSSPDCGHTYVRQGKHQVRATSYWQVDWSGMGQSGSIPLSFSDTALVTIGEAQVLTQ